MKQKLQNFMQGRYGLDALYHTLLMGAVLSSLLSLLTRDIPVLSNLLGFASMATITWAIFRVMSRNIEKRYLENLHYLERIGSLRHRILFKREKHRQRKEYKFFVCPTCRTNLRVPKGKGKVNITCTKCGNRFSGKT